MDGRGWAGEVNGGAADEDGGVGGGGPKVCTHGQHAVTCSFLPGYLPSFTFCLFGSVIRHTRMCAGDTLGHCGSRGTVSSVDTSQRPTARSLSPSSIHPPALPPSPPFSPIAPTTLSSPPLSVPDSVVIINTPSSCADAWLESAPSPVAGLKSDGVGGEAQRLSESQVMQPQADGWRELLSVTSEMWWMCTEGLRCASVPECQV